VKKKPSQARLGGGASANAASSFDRRQRAVVKIHYFNHTGGSGGGLKAHAKYVARDAAARDDAPTPETKDAKDTEVKEAPRAHAAYLDRGRTSVFYDAENHAVDGRDRAEAWAKSDRRHFRVILSTEEGGQLKDLPSYTRQVMARAGASLGATLSWIAVDHHDTDNPHTHIIIRGRRANGQDLVIPKEFIKHGFRSVARDVATEWLGQRSPDDDRRELDREIRRHAPTRLDTMVEAQATKGRVRTADLNAPNGDAALTQALKARVHELERLGLVQRETNGLFRLDDNFRERLRAMEFHIDVRKRVVLERAAQGKARAQSRLKGLLDR
jgi:type IV secretory pathway VirD2 relaxase